MNRRFFPRLAEIGDRLTPNVALSSAKAAGIGWVESDAEWVALKLEPYLACGLDRSRLAEQASRYAAKGDDHTWFGTPDVG